MEITTHLDGEEMRIALRGRLDSAWSPLVSKTLQDTIQSGCHHIALDLSQVDYLSSAGIRVLVIAAKNLKTIAGSLRLHAASPQVSEILQLVGIGHLFVSAAPPSTKEAVRDWAHGENQFAVYELNPDASQQGRVLNGEQQAIAIQARTWVIGQGALGKQATDNKYRYGELLAIHSLAIALPGDDPEHPDWLLREGELIPEVELQNGLCGQGEFRYLARFGQQPQQGALHLSELAQAALDLCQSDTVAVAMLAETAQLVGASKQMPLDAQQARFFDFPAIRDHLLFTAEPAYGEDTCLIIGVAAKNPAPALAMQLRPLADNSPLFVHFHACVVPFHPVRKGLIDLGESLSSLLETQRVRSVLHLLNDDREGVGAGESQLRRGAMWCAAIEFNEEHSK